MTNGGKAVASELCLLAASLLIALAAAEGALRVFSPQQRMTPAYDDRDGMRVFKSDTAIKHKTRWFDVLYHTNALGLRGPLYDQAKPRGVYRIIALGPSFTFGIGNDDEWAYPARLEADLNASARGRRYQVLNFGWPGIPMNSYEPLDREVLSKYGADAMVVHLHSLQVGMEEARKKETLWAADRTSSPFVMRLRRWMRAVRRLPGYTWLCENSHLWALIRLRISAGVDRIGIEQRSLPAPDDACLLQRTWIETFDSFVDSAFALRGGRFRLLVTWDASQPATSPLILAHLRALAARRPGFLFIELNMQKRFIYEGEGHWNPEGNDYVARTLADELRAHALP